MTGSAPATLSTPWPILKPPRATPPIPSASARSSIPATTCTPTTPAMRPWPTPSILRSSRGSKAGVAEGLRSRQHRRPAEAGCGQNWPPHSYILLHSYGPGCVISQEAMRICLVLAFAAALQGAVIRGSVVENQTGHFLARAVVGLEPVDGSAGPHLSVRTNLSGFFEFANLPAGTYLVTAARRAFAPVQYGQKHWRASGVPIVRSEEHTSELQSLR